MWARSAWRRGWTWWRRWSRSRCCGDRGGGAAGPGRGGPAAQAEPFGSLGLWCVLVFLSGYVIVALEIVWVRLLGQFGQYHAYLFPTVLGTFLLADGLGMALAARMLRRLRDPRPAFFLTQGLGFLLGIALLGALWVAIGVPPLRDWMGVDFDRFGTRELGWTTAIIVAVVAPPSFVIGMTFPFVQRAVQQDLASVGARVGWVQLANILGNAAGSLLTGLLTFHWLGHGGDAAAALPSVARAAGLPHRGSAGSATGPVGALRSDGAGRDGDAVQRAALGADARHRRSDTLTAWGEDRSGVVLWRERATLPGREEGRFFIMGHGQGFVPFLDTHILLGMLGPLLHPDPQRVLAIGVGSGGTPWGATVNPATREMRGVELVAPVLDALREIAAARPDSGVAALLADPRVRLEYGDGRRALMRGDGLYDVIEADAIRPQSSHSGLLYSAEFLEQVKQRLAPGGLYVQWAPSWRVVDTFAAAFPYVVLLRPVQVMIGSDRPIPSTRRACIALLRRPDVVAHARRGNPASGDLSPLVAGGIERWGPDTPRGRRRADRHVPARRVLPEPRPPGFMAPARPPALSGSRVVSDHGAFACAHARPFPLWAARARSTLAQRCRRGRAGCPDCATSPRRSPARARRSPGVQSAAKAWERTRRA
jgi:spermidine synthase